MILGGLDGSWPDREGDSLTKKRAFAVLGLLVKCQCKGLSGRWTTGLPAASRDMLGCGYGTRLITGRKPFKRPGLCTLSARGLRIQSKAPGGIDAEPSFSRTRSGGDVPERYQVRGGKSENTEVFPILDENKQSRHCLISCKRPCRSIFAPLPESDERTRLRWCDPGGAYSPLFLPHQHYPGFVVAVLLFCLNHR